MTGSCVPERDALVILGRYPEAGHTKTRLGKVIGHERAAALYRAFLTDLDERFSAAAAVHGYSLHWAYTPAGSAFAALVRSGLNCFPQEGQSFGERLWNVFRRFGRLGYRRVVLIGSDLPHLPASLVADAFSALDDADAVFGPADGGGYYLIALPVDTPPPDLFTIVPMSTSYTLRATLAVAHQLRIRLLRPTFDVDHPADLERLAAVLADGTISSPCTSALLCELFPMQSDQWA